MSQGKVFTEEELVKCIENMQKEYRTKISYDHVDLQERLVLKVRINELGRLMEQLHIAPKEDNLDLAIEHIRQMATLE